MRCRWGEAEKHRWRWWTVPVLASSRNLKKKEESLRYRISLQGQTVVTAVFKSVADAWRNTLKPNIATPDDLWWRNASKEITEHTSQISFKAEQCCDQMRHVWPNIADETAITLQTRAFPKRNQGTNVWINKNLWLTYCLKCVLSFSSSIFLSELILCR